MYRKSVLHIFSWFRDFSGSHLFITARVAKRAKVIVFTGICLSNKGGGGGQHQRSNTPPWPGSKVTTPPPGSKVTTPPPGSKVITPPPGSKVITPPLARVKGHNTSPRPGSKVTTPPHPRHYAQAGSTHPTGMHSCYPNCCLTCI